MGESSVAVGNGRAAAAGKQERDEVFVEYTKSICPVCKVVVDAQVNIRGGKVYLRKRCREHGSFEALVYGDAQAYLASARFNKSGTIPLTFQTEVREGCPLDCGLCPEHKQHACLGVIEVNTNCNLDCPICFADSGHQPDGYAITPQQCERMLDAFVASEGEAEVVMFSGGEPTIHKNILGFLDAAQARPIRSITSTRTASGWPPTIRSPPRSASATAATVSRSTFTCSSTALTSAPTGRSGDETCGRSSVGRWTTAPGPGSP